MDSSVTPPESGNGKLRRLVAKLRRLVAQPTDSAALFTLGVLLFLVASAVALFSRDSSFAQVHPFAVTNLAAPDSIASETVVNLNDLTVEAIFPALMIFAAAVSILVPMSKWLEPPPDWRTKPREEKIRGPTGIARKLYCSERGPGTDTVANQERRRREEAVARWSGGYAKVAIVLMMVEVVIALLLVDAAEGVVPLVDPTNTVISSLYVVRLLAWLALFGFIAWVVVRPLAIDCIFDVSDLPTGSAWMSKPPIGTALAFSGGGIRSAAFTLGAVDALQDHPKEWSKVRHVCAVSGGAYTAGAWAGLRSDREDATRRTEADEALRLGGPGLRHIRNNSTYLAPGLFGKVRAFNDWGSGVIVTVGFYAASVFAVGGALGFVAAFLQNDPRQLEPSAVAGWSFFLAGVVGVATTVFSHRAEDETSDYWRRCGETFGWIWAFLGFLVLVVPTFLDLVQRLDPPPVAWVVGTFTGGVLTFAAVWSVVKKASAPVATFLAGLIVPAFTVAGLVYSAHWGVKFNPFSDDREISTALTIATVVIVLTLVAGYLLDVNLVSLSPFYRRRLSTAFSLGWTKTETGSEVEMRDSPIGLSDIEQLQEGESEHSRPVATTICAAANVMSSPITPPGRGSLSFTFSGDKVGIPHSPKMPGACVPTEEFKADYKTPKRKAPRDFTLMQAVAISGAAVSPGMGKMTKRSYEALLAVFNVRLGAWLPNPFNPATRSEAENNTGGILNSVKKLERHRLTNRPRMLPYFYKELLGLHNVLDPYLYITDGGHWDNLALVEALRERPQKVFVFDSSGDRPGTFATLGEAISLAEMELGVRIELDSKPLTNDVAPAKAHWWSKPSGTGDTQSLPQTCIARGKATYPEGGGECEIIYCRALITNDVPVYISSFKSKHASFPSHSTLRQLYDDETFEAYRELGYHCASSIVPTESMVGSERPVGNLRESAVSQT